MQGLWDNDYGEDDEVEAEDICPSCGKIIGYYLICEFCESCYLCGHSAGCPDE